MTRTAVDDVAKDEAVAAPSSSAGARQEVRQFSNERVRPSRAPGVIDMETSSGDLEEVLLRSIAADAAGGLDCALYDKTLSHASGAGLLFNQVVRCMSHAIVGGSSDAVLSVLCRL